LISSTCGSEKLSPVVVNNYVQVAAARVFKLSCRLSCTPHQVFTNLGLLHHFANAVALKDLPMPSR
jgi:hypothetical protein